MELIPSFKVDHSNLYPGIYVSRIDNVGNDIVTTYDIRMIYVNHEPAVSPTAMHTIEHLGATYLRNDSYWKDSVIYWGPMGCLTGFYLILKGEHNISDLRNLMILLMGYISNYEDDIPGNKPEECGNYTFHNLQEARYAAEKYRGCLIGDFHCEYPEKSEK